MGPILVGEKPFAGPDHAPAIKEPWSFQTL